MKHDTERQKSIELLMNLGAEDLTHLKHPNNVRKKYLRIWVNKIKHPKTYIDFNFDYPEYDEVSVISRRAELRGYKKFHEIDPMLRTIGLY